MKLIALEEHYATPGIMTSWRGLDPATRDFAIERSIGTPVEAPLLDLGEARLAAMDAAGVDVAVLSHTAPGSEPLPAAVSIALARDANDRLAEAVRRHPDRLQGFATLPMADPEAAARELERAVKTLGLNGALIHGRTHAGSLDHPAHAPVLEAAAALRAPLYLHPQTPPPAVREAYYQGLGREVEVIFASSGFGWHVETGLQTLRLILSGAFERWPDLRLILGHWGEVVLFYLDRIDAEAPVAKLPRSVTDYFRSNIWVTPSGIFSQRYLRWAVEVLGADRLLMSTDHPFQTFRQGEARRFLEASALTEAERRGMASGTWERLVREIRR